ncbi:hypothetical protein [Vibrio splendidus]|uniref:hypothetical protein n=1 Tax=Vibrio splendidus TaxID=29497 RepID=UPI00076ACD75|nr:hypothetical protein [Vibrio splendidus]PHX06552.1 hypothetical protein VSPL_18420 [Vibrio splendidus]
MNKANFLDYLSVQFDIYNQLSDKATQNEAKQFINGMMTASRFFGVSYPELQAAIPSELKLCNEEVDAKPTIEEHFQSKDLSSPTFHRQGKRVVGLYRKKQ